MTDLVRDAYTYNESYPKALRQEENMETQERAHSQNEQQREPRATEKKPNREFPVLPLDDLVVFPHMPPVPPFPPHHVALSGEMATAALEATTRSERGLCIFRPNPDITYDGIPNITKADLSPIGSLVHILRFKKDDGDVLFLAHGRERVKIEEILSTEPFISARVAIVNSEAEIVDGLHQNLELEALVRSNEEMFQRIVAMSGRYQEEYGAITKTIEQPGRLADYIAAVLDLKPTDKQRILEAVSVTKRLNSLAIILARELDLHELENKIQHSAQSVINKGQREYYLREQLKAIQTELGEAEDLGLEIDELREQLRTTVMPEKAKQTAEKELNRLAKMQSFSPESTVSRNYLDWLLNLPWEVSTEDSLNLRAAKTVLDEDHYGLEKVKERIVEHLAVRMLHTRRAKDNSDTERDRHAETSADVPAQKPAAFLTPEMKSPIFCFVGPPGVGKTSLGRSIARAMDRKFVRVSLGGMHDEAEIRGHRRTYIGSMPGRILKGLRTAESNNPIFMLDEIDKLGTDFRGDPGAALLEVLDPEQNHAFTDNYLDVPFDLSKVMFITTANQLDTIPIALRDRMETLELAGYTTNEKLQIAKQYLLPRQLTANGLTAEQLHIDDAAIDTVISAYTREAGVRNLERELGTLCRKEARRIAEGMTAGTTKISAKSIPDYLGPEKFTAEVAGRKAEIGIATGLSVTPAGGEILFVEVATYSRTAVERERAQPSQLRITGQLGNVMQESAQTALSYVKSQAAALHFDPGALDTDIHIHVPAGAIPKDGPSAGITIATALASIATGKSISPDIAMTGELTLRGRVLPIGGLKEKILAAKQAGIKKIIVPRGNENHFVDIPEDIQSGITFRFVEFMSEVFQEIFS